MSIGGAAGSSPRSGRARASSQLALGAGPVGDQEWVCGQRLVAPQGQPQHEAALQHAACHDVGDAGLGKPLPMRQVANVDRGAIQDERGHVIHLEEPREVPAKWHVGARPEAPADTARRSTLAMHHLGLQVAAALQSILLAGCGAIYAIFARSEPPRVPGHKHRLRSHGAVAQQAGRPWASADVLPLLGPVECRPRVLHAR
mmetsp:Transcript_10899/g.32849  ORF Transcript_10899/g.32849 Transcript_10899/m.32849 type:complete len:201 (-) Transcript_10899:654-1256(-)